MRKSVLLFFAVFFFLFQASAQQVTVQNPNSGNLQLTFPNQPGWNIIKEGQALQFDVKATGGSGTRFLYSLTQGGIDEMSFDTLGHFSWTPSYDFVDRLAKDKTVQLIFEARNEKDQRVKQVIDLKVEHVNRSPVIGELKPFYVQYDVNNTYTIESSAIKDPDNDPIIIVPISNSMPEGAKLSEQGEFTWKPSNTQFNRLRNNPITLEFYVEDQPSKARTKGQFRIEVTQQDLPPSILVIPSQKRFRFKEDATLNLKLQINDPNGENDITTFNFRSESSLVPASALVKNSPSQYEFIWRPGYDFVKDPLDSITFSLTFFAIDKSNKQQERTVMFSILNAVNEVETDRKLYQEYRSSLLRTWDLIEQLKVAENDLKRKYNKARKGKKARSLTSATLGAGTGISPLVIEVPNTTEKITTIGGTLVMTIGTLEATEVIGRSTKDLVERLNYIMEKRNELQTKGDIFARKYGLKSSRRRPEFVNDRDELVALLSLRGLVALELDSGWQNKNKPTNENIAKTFKDFNPEN
ncbi:hypothetical protein [Adhaeribacter radiodurans]|uniref:Cadherin repeat domain-containing protein n=1 Tax=Adhaeribacter radiodurans TaxID=2745197 RepID=A0A7L7L916_9BACT|nr:hypothetical protein [Adhaeribacter radiodurans]QMU29308.1 hypothetical protein HUW48_15260 [Adhaeribacter radiodurans]